MCYVTATELKKNLSHYLALSENEDVYVTKSGKIISVLMNPKERALYDFFSFHKTIQVIEKDESDDESLAAELMKKCGC